MISRDTYIQLTKFGIVGGISFGVDVVIYYLLSGLLGWPTILSKTISVVISTMVNYYLNTTWTWGQNQRDKKRFTKYMILYCISGSANVFSNELFLHLLPNSEIALQFFNHENQETAKELLRLKFDKLAAIILATIVGMIANFLGQKLWVFKQK